MTTKNDLAGLFTDAQDEGVISGASASIITGSMDDLVIAGADGTDSDELEADEIMLFTMLVDSSSSIAYRKLEGAVRSGYNTMLDALAGSREADSILTALWTFESSAKVVHSYVPVDDATRLDTGNYRGSGCTALYDTWVKALQANLAYAQSLRNVGNTVRSVVVVLTDGEDVGSRLRPTDCATLSRDLLGSEQFILAFVGVGNETDFCGVALSMGVPDGSILVQKDATPSGLRATFALVSRSAIRASQGQVNAGPQQGFF